MTQYSVQVTKLVRFTGSVKVTATSPSDALRQARLAISKGQIQTSDADWSEQEYVDWSFEISGDVEEDS